MFETDNAISDTESVQRRETKRARFQLEERQKAYQKVFDKSDPSVQIVLDDLKQFCRSDESCFDPDQRVHAMLEGRREVTLRIGHHLELNTKDLFELYN